ncbi:MAG: sulfatase [Candidatus Sumerlaeota bacterium]|nr:sulfatase [Candidatus Sumerlaeota bacterium]
MNRREWLKTVSTGLAGLAAPKWVRSASAGAAASAYSSGRPNIIFILTDDQGWPETSFQMDPTVADSTCPYFETPNMARLAGQSMRFTSGYAPAPICTPTRRSIQCGMTPARERGTEFPSDHFVPAEHLTIPKALKTVDPDYRCAHFGKWGEQMLSTPEQVGYDVSDGETGNETGGGMGGKGADRRPVVAPEPKDDPKLIFSVTQRAMDFMERQVGAKHPFYMQVSYYAVHWQIQYRDATVEKYRKKGDPQRDAPLEFAAMLDDLDTGIGELLGKIDALGIADNTYIFFSADNGGQEHDAKNPLYVKHLGVAPKAAAAAGTDGAKEDGTDNLAAAPNPSGKPRLPDDHPLRGAKQWLYEGGIRVPYVVRGPGIKAGALCGEPVVHYDLLPTFVDLAGGKGPLPDDLDGGSLRPLLENEGKGSVKRALPGLVFHRPARGYSAFRQGDYKLVVNWATEKNELFDLSKDVGEENDLSAKMPEKTAEMYATLTDYLKKVNAETYQKAKPKAGQKKAPQKKAPPKKTPSKDGNAA